MISRNDMRKIKQLAIEIDHMQAFGGKSRGNKHLSRVVKISLFMSKKLNANKDVVEAAAYLHDAALPTKNDDDYTANKKLIARIFKKSTVNFNRDFVYQVAEAVASHEGFSLPRTLEAKIIHDADVIEKTGILGIIRHTWKLTNHNKIDPENIRDEDISTLVKHIKWRQSILQTDIAKKMSKNNSCPISIKTLRKTVPVISQLAAHGVITEKIARRIEPLLNKSQIKSLNNQLTLAYLKTDC